MLPSLQEGASKALLAEWNVAKNLEELHLTPSDVTLGSTKRVHWLCPGQGYRCGMRHSWVAPVERRARSGEAVVCCCWHASPVLPYDGRCILPRLRWKSTLRLQLARGPAPWLGSRAGCRAQ